MLRRLACLLWLPASVALLPEPPFECDNARCRVRPRGTIYAAERVCAPGNYTCASCCDPDPNCRCGAGAAAAVWIGVAAACARVVPRRAHALGGINRAPRPHAAPRVVALEGWLRQQRHRGRQPEQAREPPEHRCLRAPKIFTTALD